MEIQLNIYEKGNIIKTYKTNELYISTGLCNDLLEYIDFDKLSAIKDSEELGKEIIKIVLHSYKKFKTIIQDLFPDMTDQEYNKTRIQDITALIIQIVNFTISNLFLIQDKTKN